LSDVCLLVNLAFSANDDYRLRWDNAF
jgi:hypothetical protein